MEYWDLYDENRTLKNKLHLRGEPVADGDYHIVVYMWIFTPDGKILLTRRHPDKPWGLYWECTGGAAQTGEDSVAAVLREVREEIGLMLSDGEFELALTVKHTHSFQDVYVCIKEIDAAELALQACEVVDAKLVTLDGFCAMRDAGELVPLDYDFNALYFNAISHNSNFCPKKAR